MSTNRHGVNTVLQKSIDKSAIAFKATHPLLQDLYEAWRTEMDSSDSFGFVADHVVALTSDFYKSKADKLFFIEMLEHAARELKDYLQKNP